MTTLSRQFWAMAYSTFTSAVIVVTAPAGDRGVTDLRGEQQALRVQQSLVAAGQAQQAVLGSGNQYVSFGVSAVPLAAAARDPAPVFTAADVEVFTGRRWLVAEVDRFIARNPCGYVLVEAEAGMGKTAFAAWLAKTRGYLSHFSRYNGGRSTRSALQNLSAQLIVKFDLSDAAPGGMLPEWAYSAEGFEFLLSRAATRARESGCRIVLVVDGLDEAEPTGGGLPFGLPKLLPDGVYVVATYRTGWSPGRPETAAVTVGIGKDDPRNVRDIGEFLTRLAGEEVLADRLAEALTAPTDFVRLLAERCGGVWVYLRYVLDELRLGLRRADAASDLPYGLHGYYADQIRCWQRDPAWEECLLPLLATLGVAGEPLPSATLGRLAGNLSPSDVRRLCDLTFRPLLTTTRAEPGALLRYEIYHASFRQVLKADHSEPDLASGGLSYELEALADHLRQATRAAHSRIADTYIGSFGGLSAGLPVLASSPAAAGADDGYPLRHLVRHLHHAGRTADLHQILATSGQLSYSRRVNVWFTAHDTTGFLVSYLNDLSRAQVISAAATARAIGRQQPAPSLGMEIRYAFMAASITSRANGIRPELLDLLMHTGKWSPERGLDHARRLTDPDSRFHALMTVHEHVTAARKPLITGEALAAAAAISDDYFRAEALTGLIPHLGPDQIALALDAAATISDSYRRAEALTGLIPHLGPDQIALALDAAAAISDDSYRAQVLTLLVPHLPPGRRHDALAQALDAAAAISDSDGCAEALTGLVPHLPASQRSDALARALDAAAAISNDSNRAQALTRLVPHLPASQRSDALARALDAATKATRGLIPLTRALTSLIPHLGPDQIALALDAAAAISDSYRRAQVLIDLMPHLPPDQQDNTLARALHASAAISNESNRAKALAELAPYLSADQLARVLDLATAISDDYHRAQALTGMAPYLPPDQLTRALDAAAAISRDYHRAEALTGMAPYLPPDQLTRTLDAAAAISDDSDRARALTGLIPYLPPDQQSEALAHALDAASAISDDYHRAQALTGLAPHLAADPRPEILARALDAATAISRADFRAEALTGLAPYLPPGQQSEALARALDAATAISDDYHRAQALTGLAPHLAADPRPEILARALDAATAISGDSARAEALTKLAPHLQPDQLARVLHATTAISDGFPRAEVLAGLAPYLLSDQLADALDAAATIRDSARGHALKGLAPYLPPDQLADALDAATAISDADFRAKALTGLAPHLGTDQLARALDAATAVSDDFCRAAALTGLAPHLPPDQQPDALARALDAATAVSDGFYRVLALIDLIPHLPHDQRPDALARALDTATAISDDYYRALGLTRLAPHLPPEQRPDALARALDTATAISDDYARMLALTELAQHLAPDQLTRALDAATAIGDESHRALALTGLARHLRPDQLARALDIAIAISSPSHRAQALTRLAPHLPPDQLTRAMNAYTSISDIEATTAILIRGEAILPVAEYGDLLRFSLNGRSRAFCLSVVTRMASSIVKYGGVSAVSECVRAITDVSRWWP